MSNTLVSEDDLELDEPPVTPVAPQAPQFTENTSDTPATGEPIYANQRFSKALSAPIPDHIPGLELHYTLVFPKLAKKRFDQNTGEPILPENQQGGKFAFRRLNIVNRVTKRNRIVYINCSIDDAHKFPLGPDERLSNPPWDPKDDVGEFLWRLWAGPDAPRPQTYKDDLRHYPKGQATPNIELCYGNIQVMFDDQKTFADCFEKLTGVNPLPEFPAGDEIIQKDGSLIRVPKLNEVFVR